MSSGVGVTPPSALDAAMKVSLRVTALETENARLAATLAARESRIRWLEEALRGLRADRYGPSREKLEAVPGQSLLFNEAEVLVDLAEARGEPIEPHAKLTPTPKREDPPAAMRKPGRRPLAAHLARREIRHELPVEERVCGCGTALVEIGAVVTEQLDYRPAKVEVLKHLRIKYACPGCETCVRTAAVPEQVLPKSNAAAGLLAQIVTAKYVDSLPLHRQESIYARLGVELSRATMASWVLGLTSRVQPLLNLMAERLLASGYVRMDETPLQVLTSDRSPDAEHWMWVRVAGPERERLILFDYDPRRNGEAAYRLLEGAGGYLQTDGHAAYDGVAARLGLIHVGCFAHARRRAFEAIKVLPKEAANTWTPAHELVRRIDALYALERELKPLAPEARHAARQERAVPLLTALHDWARDTAAATLPSGKLGEAFRYLLKQWEKLVRYVEDPRLALDTNAAENAIRPFALGRKNWLYCNTVAGAKASAALYSLVSTAKANGLEPSAYLRHLFDRLPHARTVDDFERLLPFSSITLS